MNETALYKPLTLEQIAGMTTTELLAILETERMTVRQMREIRAEIKSRVI